jgi:hypothetical protein
MNIFLKKVTSIEFLKFTRILCRGRDLNPRTSTGTDLESVAVDQAWLPLHREYKKHYGDNKSLGF